MKEEFSRIEKAERYLSGEMKDLELRDFKKTLNQDTHLLKIVEELKSSIGATKLYGRTKLKSELGKIHKKLFHSKAIKESKSTASEKFSTFLEKLFEKYFVPYEDLISVRSKKQGVLETAMEEYSRGNYNTAIKLYKSILKDKPKDIHALFYCGISLLETSKSNEAKSKFTKLLKIEGNIFKDQAEWYLGLSYLKSNNVKEAMKIFDKISKDNVEYRKARNIVKKLKDVS